MQGGDAYVQQVPMGARPPAAHSAQVNGVAAARTPPAGLYVQVADVRTQAEAIRASLELAQRLGPARPAFVRGVVVQAAEGAHVLMFGGPFGDAAAARAFCEAAFGPAPCLTHTFAQAKAVR